MANPQDQGKTEEPTSRRLEEAKEKGDYPKSTELNTSVSLLTFMILVSILIPYYGNVIISTIKKFVSLVGVFSFTPQFFSDIYTSTIILVMKLLAPFLLPVALMAIIVTIAQQEGNFLFLTERLNLDFSKVFNISKGLKKVFASSETYMELLKSILKIFFFTLVAYLFIRGDIMSLTILPQTTLKNILHTMGWIIFKISIVIILFMVILSFLDYIWQRYRYKKKMMMSKQEIKEEYKNMEGDPLIKSKRRAKQMQVAAQRMMASVPHADVVITNPTHYAVALKYDKNDMPAPKVLAKGKDLLALRIKSEAEKHKITIVENPPLARGLYASVEIEQYIPEKFFKSIAEILALIYKAKGKKVS